jgi:hypothetical protein
MSQAPYTHDIQGDFLFLIVNNQIDTHSQPFFRP